MAPAKIHLTINGLAVSLCAEARTTLADALRGELRLTGAQPLLIH